MTWLIQTLNTELEKPPLKCALKEVVLQCLIEETIKIGNVESLRSRQGQLRLKLFSIAGIQHS